MPQRDGGRQVEAGSGGSGGRYASGIGSASSSGAGVAMPAAVPAASGSAVTGQSAEVAAGPGPAADGKQPYTDAEWEQLKERANKAKDEAAVRALASVQQHGWVPHERQQVGCSACSGGRAPCRRERQFALRTTD